MLVSDNMASLNAPVSAHEPVPLRMRLEEAGRRLSELALRTGSVADNLAGAHPKAVSGEGSSGQPNIMAIAGGILNLIASIEDNVARIDNTLG